MVVKASMRLRYFMHILLQWFHKLALYLNIKWWYCIFLSRPSLVLCLVMPFWCIWFAAAHCTRPTWSLGLGPFGRRGTRHPVEARQVLEAMDYKEESAEAFFENEAWTKKDYVGHSFQRAAPLFWFWSVWGFSAICQNRVHAGGFSALTLFSSGVHVAIYMNFKNLQ